MIDLFWPSHDKAKILKALSKVLSTRWIGQGQKVDEFEKKFGLKFGFKYCVAANSGTSALELAYHLLDIQEGDEILVPVLTCLATNIPLLRRKAKIVFVDIEKDTLNADPDDMAKKITKKTKAIVVTKLGGVPINPKVFTIARSKKIPVVIDGCQALGVPEKNGDYVVYSFQAIKHFHTGDGGMLILRNKKEYKHAKLLRWFGIDRQKKVKLNWKTYKRRRMTMETKEAGYKFHMNDIAAAMGLVGLEESDKLLTIRKKTANFYRENIKLPSICGGSRWLFAILTEKRDALAKYLFERNIDTNLVHIRNDISSLFGGKRQNLPNMNYIESRYLYLPLHAKMTLKDAKLVFNAVNSFLKAKK